MPEPTPAAYYRHPEPSEPIKTGDIFVGGALVSPDNPLLSLREDFELGPESGPETYYQGPITAYEAPIHDATHVGALVDLPIFGIGYVILLSYTCDYSEPAKDHPFRLVAPLWDLFGLPPDNGLRGFVWKRPADCPAIYYPLPPLRGHFGQSYVNLRQMGIIHREVIPANARVASLTQPAKHLLWRKLALFLTRVRVTEAQLDEIDARYPSAAEQP